MVQKIERQDNVWIDIQNPTKDELYELRDKYQFHDLDVEDCLSKVQRPKLERYDDYKFIVLHLPMIPHKSYRLKVEEVDIFWGKNFLVTIHSNKQLKLTEIFTMIKNNSQMLEDYFSAGCDYLLYKVLHEMVVQNFSLLSQISHEIDWLDSTFEVMRPTKVIERISALRRNIIFLQTTLKPQREIFRIFENQLKDQEEKEMDIYWGDINDYITKQLDMAEDYQELTEGLYSSIDTLLTFRTNNIMKTLTLFSVVMLPLTFITSFYGMNVNLPFDDFESAFAGISVAMLIIVVAMLIYFKVRRM